ncbi:MAG: [Fe-Fe] hydrogenase large subunit C-terminal domain-containing protein [Spirochaetia bacterium]
MDVGLKKIIEVDADKCVNCHACIDACPVKFCNDGSSDHVTVNQELCIGCGSCIHACTHDARKGIDNTSEFLSSLETGEPVVAVLSPAAAAVFPDMYKNLVGWLKKSGVKAVFDVSFGAELTVYSYIKKMKQNPGKAVIAQPCPAIVTYLELYKPELLNYLAPADSPIIHTIKMIREYYPSYKKHKVAVISPCYAKRREFDETGYGDFNVTYVSLKEHFAKQKIDLKKYPCGGLDGPEPERAVLFSTPGGLLKTVEREIAGAGEFTRKIEGPDIVYKYLDNLKQSIGAGHAPLLIDCLNCELGCNGGTATGLQNANRDEIEYFVAQRAQGRKKQMGTEAGLFSLMGRHRLKGQIKKYWKKGLYDRRYVDRSERSGVRIPKEEEFDELYKQLHKRTKEDYLNCGACGYNDCESMAIAVFNGLNKPNNCFHYERLKRGDMVTMLVDEMQKTASTLQDALMVLTGEKRATGQIDMKEISNVSDRTMESLNEGVVHLQESLDKMRQIRETSKRTIAGINNLNEHIDSIWEIVSMINAVADQTKIIAFNAELEASAAGETGKNFEIVATEIRRLADSTMTSTKEIKEKIQQIQGASENLIIHSTEETQRINEGMELSEKISSLFEELLTFTEDSSVAIENSVNTQVSTFQDTLYELNHLTRQLGKYKRE